MLKPKPDIIHILYTIYIYCTCIEGSVHVALPTRLQLRLHGGRGERHWAPKIFEQWLLNQCWLMIVGCYIYIHIYTHIIPIFFLGLHMISYHNPPWNHCQPGFLGMTECSARCSFSWVLSCCGFCMFYVVNISKHMLSFGPWWIELDIRT